MERLIAARAHGWAEQTFAYKWADAAKDPGAEMGNVFAIEDTLNKTGAARAATTDANSMIYTAKANQLYKQALADYREPTLDPAIRAELDDFVERRKREGGAPTDF